MTSDFGVTAGHVEYSNRRFDFDTRHMVTIEVYSKINAMHIERVMEGIADNRTQVRNTKAYLLASLFNSVSTLDNHCTMQYNCDFGGFL